MLQRPYLFAVPVEETNTDELVEIYALAKRDILAS